MATAWGKVLLFGEHAVVHGQPAVAVGVAPGTEALARRCDRPTLRVSPWSLEVAFDDDHRVAEAWRRLVDALPFDAHGLAVDATCALPSGAGLGSSASLLVAIARALADARGVRLADAALFDAVLAGERVFHGNPSGLDHAAAMHGGALRFVRGTPPRVEPLRVGAPLHLILARVEPGGDTARLVAGVAERLATLGEAGARALLDAFGRTADAGVAALEAGDLPRLGALLDTNHGLLVAAGVSTPGLCAASHDARRAGALGAKLTGAGGGGSLVALAPDPASAARVAGALDAPDRWVRRLVVDEHGPRTASPPLGDLP